MEEEKLSNQSLYGVCFDEFDGGILLLMTEDSIMLNLSGGRVPSEFLENSKDERWRRDFLVLKFAEQTGLTHTIKNGKSIPLAESIQPMPAVYNVDTEGCNQRYSAIIVGDVKYCSLKTQLAAFYGYESFVEAVKMGRVTKEQELLILRAFVSRDYPNRCESRRAVPELKKKHN
jgi:hypothetical protein